MSTPTDFPSMVPSGAPSLSMVPSGAPSLTSFPSSVPTGVPSLHPSISGAPSLSSFPSGSPTLTSLPSYKPSTSPSEKPSVAPTELSELGILKEVMLDLGFSSDELSSNDYCDWKGVSCDKSGDVTKLEFSKLELSGFLATEIGLLGNLESLEIYKNNKVKGTIPTEIGLLEDLTNLDLYGNDFSGTIPTEIGNLDELKTLYLGENDLAGTIPTELGKLDDLEIIYLNDNDLTGTVPLELANMDSLEELYINGNNLVGSVNHLCSTVWIVFDSPQVTGVGPGCSNPPDDPISFWLNIINFVIWILSLLGIDTVTINIGGGTTGD